MTETTMAVTVLNTVTAIGGSVGLTSDEFLRVGGHRRAEIGETGLVLVVVVTAEQEFAPGGENGTDAGSGAAPVTPIGGGEGHRDRGRGDDV
ncbi:hypothetical protein GCM10009773_33450 [Williamsia serinedens]